MRTSLDDGYFLRPARPQADRDADLPAPDEAAHVRPLVDGLVVTRERARMLRPQPQHAPHELRLRRAPRRPVHGPAVVGVDERERLVLVALVDVGDAGAGEL